jgi:hypothetical protein
LATSRLKRKSNPTERKKAIELDLPADTGAIYTVIPEDILQSLGIEPFGRKNGYIKILNKRNIDLLNPCLEVVLS